MCEQHGLIFIGTTVAHWNPQANQLRPAREQGAGGRGCRWRRRAMRLPRRRA